MQEPDRTPIPFPDLVALEGVEEESTLRRSIGFCAFHGGNLERRTELIARQAAERSDASLYTVVQPYGMRRHVTSADVGAEPTEALQSFLDHCDVVIALHGFGRKRYFTSLLCGGRNRALGSHVSHHLRRALPYYDTIDDLDRIPIGLRGQHPTNPCNLPSNGGIQLELPPRVRGLSPLANYWPTSPGDGTLFPHLNYLIDGLAEAARCWDDDTQSP